MMARRERQAKDRIQHAEIQARDEIQNAAIDVATEAAKTLLAAQVGGKKGEVLIDNAIDEISDKLN
jgi:F-type H+-transporting ATPase subunit b